MIVARADQHAAVLRRTLAVAVLEHVAAAIHPRSLAVPDREDAVVPGARQQRRLLRAPDGRRREVLVDARLEHHVGVLEPRRFAPELHVVCAERRTAVTRDEAGGVQARGLVQRPLQQRQPHERLRTAHEHSARGERVLVVEADVRERCGCGHVCDLSERAWRPTTDRNA